MSEPKPLTEKELHTDIGSDGCWDCARHNRNKYDLDEKHFLLVDVLGALEGLKKDIFDYVEQAEIYDSLSKSMRIKHDRNSISQIIDKCFPFGVRK